MIIDFSISFGFGNQSSLYTELYEGTGNNIIEQVSLSVEFQNFMDILQFPVFLSLINANSSTINYATTSGILGYGEGIVELNFNGKLYLQNSPLSLKTIYRSGENVLPASIYGYLRGKIIT